MNSPKQKRKLVPGIDYIGVSVVFYAHDGNGKFLFLKRSEKVNDFQGCWESGGGRLHKNETIEEALIREMSDEVNCSSLVVDEVLPPVSQIVRNDEGKMVHWLILPHIVRVDSDEVQLKNIENIEEIGWFGLDALPDPLHPTVAREIVDFAEIFQKYQIKNN
jgi:ADP-ribose pyrophosphatase YjhB (NUDIX family)